MEFDGKIHRLSWNRFVFRSKLRKRIHCGISGFLLTILNASRKFLPYFILDLFYLISGLIYLIEINTCAVKWILEDLWALGHVILFSLSMVHANILSILSRIQKAVKTVDVIQGCWTLYLSILKWCRKWNWNHRFSSP